MVGSGAIWMVIVGRALGLEKDDGRFIESLWPLLGVLSLLLWATFGGFAHGD